MNDHIPESYRAEVQAESTRVNNDVLDGRDRPNRRVLIVGGGGYIGSSLTGHLLGSGFDIRNLDLFLFGTQTALMPYLGDPGFEVIYGDHCDATTMERALVGVTDVVILSGLVGDPITKKYPDAALKINNDGMLDLIALLNGKGLNKVIFVSTCSNYGLIGEDDIADEAFALNPLSLYAKAKVAVEQVLLSLEGSVDFRPTILRFATAFGLSGRMRFDLTVSQFTRDMFLGRDLLVYDPETWRPYCHVQDFNDVILRVLEAPVERVAFDVFNAGGDVNNYTKRMIVDAIHEFLPDARVRYKEQGSDPRNYRVDFTKIKDRLFFEPRYTVRDGVQELIAALQQNMFAEVDSRPNYYGNYEIDYGAGR